MDTETIDQVKTAILKMLEESGMPAPDKITEDGKQVRCVWNVQNVTVLVDLDDWLDISLI